MNEVGLTNIFRTSRMQRVAADLPLWEVAPGGILDALGAPGLNGEKTGFIEALLTSYTGVFLLWRDAYDEPVRGVRKTDQRDTLRLEPNADVSALMARYLYLGDWELYCSVDAVETALLDAVDLWRNASASCDLCRQLGIEVLVSSFNDDDVWRIRLPGERTNNPSA